MDTSWETQFRALHARAAEALGLLGDAAGAAVSELRQGLRHVNEEVRRYAAEAFARIGGLEPVDVVALFRVLNGEVRANLRAKTGFDVGNVARRFGGGGHAAAAGFTVKTGVPQEKAKAIVKLVKDAKLKVQASIQGDAVRVSPEATSPPSIFPPPAR